MTGFTTTADNQLRFRGYDLPARYGNDEFAVTLTAN
jgi:PleD family two-component response regulator